LKEIYYIFAYLKAHLKTKMVFNPTPPMIDMTLLERQDWSFSANGCEEFKEELPSNMPPSFGPSMTMRLFVDSDHAGDLVTSRSPTGYAAFLNCTPIYWSSKNKILARLALLEASSLL
jgi:hypothetical protein